MRADSELGLGERAVEQRLLAYYAAGEPSPAFVARLEQDLAAQATAAALQAAAVTPGAARFWDGWLTAPRGVRWVTVALLVVLAIAVGALGPQRVWAEVQRLLGYVPGIGFVNLKDTRVLVVPVESTRDGVMVRIEQVIAERERTRLVVRSFGLPPSDTIFPGGAGVSKNINDFSGRLRLPDGAALDFKELFLQYGEAESRLEFAGLPAGVMNFTLEMDRLPLVPPGRAPEDWRIPVALVSADAPGAAQRFPEPYKPVGASDTHHGVTLSVENVAHTADETVIKLRGTWTDGALQIYGLNGGVAMPSLFDNAGHVYSFKSSPGSGSVAVAVVQKAVAEDPSTTPTPAVQSVDGEVSVEPLSAFAREVTLQVESIQSEIQISDTFRTTVPDGAQVGDRWPLDLTLNVAGFPVRLTGAMLDTEEYTLPEGKTTARTLLRFEIAPVPEQDGRQLSFLHVEAPETGWQSGPGNSNGRGSVTVSLSRAAEEPIPSGLMDVTIRSASVNLLGPWRMTWAIPGRDGQVVEPATLHPQTKDTHDGLTLAVEEVVHTDRLTHVLVDLQDPPSGVKLVQTQGNQRSFEDDRGRRYESDGANLSWLRSGDTYSLAYEPKLGPQQLRLPPVDPLARRFTVTLPTIEIVQEASGSFTVTVPSNVELRDHPQAPGMKESEPWPVDASMEADGYVVRYTQAMMTGRRAELWVMVGEPRMADPNRSGVSGLCGVTITGPRGEPVTSAQGNLVMAPGPCTFAPGFQPQDAAGRLVPGEYRVSFEGISVRVPGPWRLSWELGSE